MAFGASLAMIVGIALLLLPDAGVKPVFAAVEPHPLVASPTAASQTKAALLNQFTSLG